ncbi:MAG: hypothetical protein ACYCVD_05780 [Desulfitobacteriaceae bacterium]
MSGCEGYPSLEPLNFGLVIWAPISSVPGSATIFYIQPLLTSRMFASAGVLIGAELFIFLAQRIFGLEGVPTWRRNERGDFSTVQMSMSELHDFLNTVVSGKGAQGSYGTAPSGIETQFLTPTTPEAPLIVGIAVYGDYSARPFAPLVFFTLPVLTIPGIRGSLPLLILITLSTIFVRAVVPPNTAGSKPLAEPKPSVPLQLKPEELLLLLRRFGKYFGSDNH